MDITSSCCATVVMGNAVLRLHIANWCQPSDSTAGEAAGEEWKGEGGGQQTGEGCMEAESELREVTRERKGERLSECVEVRRKLAGCKKSSEKGYRPRCVSL